jgi:aryl carrier-like protein
LNAAATNREAKLITLAAIKNRFAKLLNIQERELGYSKILLHYGLESLNAAELRNWLF